MLVRRDRRRRLVLNVVAALVALGSSFVLGALGIAFGLLVAGLLLGWPAAQVRLISPRRRTVPPIEPRHRLIWPAGRMT